MTGRGRNSPGEVVLEPGAWSFRFFLGFGALGSGFRVSGLGVWGLGVWGVGAVGVCGFGITLNPGPSGAGGPKP